MAPDRILITITQEIRAHLDRLRKQGVTISGYVRNLILTDKKKKG